MLYHYPIFLTEVHAVMLYNEILFTVRRTEIYGSDIQMLSINLRWWELVLEWDLSDPWLTTAVLYFGEKYQDNDKAYDTNYYTRPEIERILKVAFEYAMKRRKHLTVVDKANVLASSRLVVLRLHTKWLPIIRR